jgi:hypothetical protein
VGVGGVLGGVEGFRGVWSIFADEKFGEVARRLPGPHGEVSGESLGTGVNPKERNYPPNRAMELGWQPISRSRVIRRSDQSGLNGPGVEV